MGFLFKDSISIRHMNFDKDNTYSAKAVGSIRTRHAYVHMFYRFWMYQATLKTAYIRTI